MLWFFLILLAFFKQSGIIYHVSNSKIKRGVNMETFISCLDQWFTTTAWRIPTPKPYGAFHICFTLIGFLVCGLIAYRLRNISPKASRRLLIGVGVFLMVTEVYKQLLYCLVIHESGYPMKQSCRAHK